MKKQASDSIHLFQLRSVPVANQAVAIKATSEDKLQLSVPFNRTHWSKAVRHLLPLSEETNIELDRLGAEIFALCDGEHTVEELIDCHKDRWKLSFFESRAMILQFLQHLMRHNFIALETPAETASTSLRKTEDDHCNDTHKTDALEGH